MEITTATLNQPDRKKDPDFCEKNNIKHSWEDGPTLTSNPGWRTRYCVNCGKGQRQSLGEQPWLDDYV